MLHPDFLAIDDFTAERLLGSLAPTGREHEHEYEAWSPELGRALADAFGITSGEVQTASKADLARAALLVLADDPCYEAPLAAIIQAPIPESFDLISATTAITVALMILKTHVVIEKDREGKIYAKIETDAAPLDLLKGLVEGLLGFALRS